MKKKFCVFMFTIPLVIYSQGVFAASFSYGNQSYTTTAPSSNFMKKNNQNLMNDACQYDNQLQAEMKKLERCKDNTFDDIYQNNTRQNAPSQNSERRSETPSWWRWENSYEGWGFD